MKDFPTAADAASEGGFCALRRRDPNCRARGEGGARPYCCTQLLDSTRSLENPRDLPNSLCFDAPKAIYIAARVQFFQKCFNFLKITKSGVPQSARSVHVLEYAGPLQFPLAVVILYVVILACNLEFRGRSVGSILGEISRVEF